MTTYADALIYQGTVNQTHVSSAREFGHRDFRRFQLSVTSANGSSPSLLVVIETSALGDPSLGDSVWSEVGRFVAMTDVGQQSVVFTGIKRFVRARETVSGSFERSLVAVPL